MPRMRLLNDAYKLIQEYDPETALTKTGLRRLALEEKIPVVKIGAKRIYDVDGIIKYLETGGSD